MSLINEALKKAQHQRSGPPTDLPPMPGTSAGSAAARRGLPTRTLAWIAAGSGAAIIVAVLVTLALVRREPPAPVPAPRVATPPPAPAAPAPVKVAAAEPAAASPVIVAPVITVPTTTPAPVAEAPAPKPAPVVPVAATPPPPAPVKATPVPTPTPAPATPTLAATGQDIRILTLIDSLRVAGIRSSGTDSKVLMNDRVYRINDVVDYALGLRLTKVGADGLTFTDPSGTTYVKNF